MIDFSCAKCGKRFSVPDNFAGRKGKCKACGAALAVPAPQGRKPAAKKPARRLPTRTRRIIADSRHIAEVFKDCEHIRIKRAKGNPTEFFEVEFRVTGLELGPNGKPTPRHSHVAQIHFTKDYPRVAPRCRMLTPIFHPNIDETTICIGDHWAAGEGLPDLIVRIGEIITYQAYNIKSPLNAEAAMWADLNEKYLPIDHRDIAPPQLVQEVA